MGERDWLTDRFEASRPRLRAVAYRMLGSHAEADDAVQEVWLRIDRADASQIDNLGGWLTTIMARVCLDRLRSRRARQEELVGTDLPRPHSEPGGDTDPAQQVLMAESVGSALLVVLDLLAPGRHQLHDHQREDHRDQPDRGARADAQTRHRAPRRLTGCAATTPGRQAAGPPAASRRPSGAGGHVRRHLDDWTMVWPFAMISSHGCRRSRGSA
jgi:RNA polymerase sigma-70 factor, ECF subfamily